MSGNIVGSAPRGWKHIRCKLQERLRLPTASSPSDHIEGTAFPSGIPLQDGVLHGNHLRPGDRERHQRGQIRAALGLARCKTTDNSARMLVRCGTIMVHQML